MNRMRSIGQVFDYIVGQDPETKMTKNGIRTLVMKNEIPSVRVGKKYLINLLHVDMYLRGDLIK